MCQSGNQWNCKFWIGLEANIDQQTPSDACYLNGINGIVVLIGFRPDSDQQCIEIEYQPSDLSNLLAQFILCFHPAVQIERVNTNCTHPLENFGGTIYQR